MKSLTELERLVRSMIVRSQFVAAFDNDMKPLDTMVDAVDIHEVTGTLIEGTYWKSVITRLEKKGHIIRRGEMMCVVCLTIEDYAWRVENASEPETSIVLSSS